MIEIIKRHEGFKSQKEQLHGTRAQISYNSDGHLCIRLLQADPKEDILVVLDKKASRKVIDFLRTAKANDLPF